MNWIWFGLMAVALLFGAANGQMQQVTEGAVAGAKLAVELAIGLVGIMALWLGVMRIAERAGFVTFLARLLRPLLRRLFDDVPPDHPAMGAMVMNIAANMLGLGNAATPLGLKAMQELQQLNPRRDWASDAMCTFLAINTSSVQLIPVSAIALMVHAGSREPTWIIVPALLATTVSTAVGVTAALTLRRLTCFQLPAEPQDESSTEAAS